jgi:hypothetical protein
MSGAVLQAVAFDASRLEVSGTPVTVVEGIRTHLTSGASQFAIADNGTLVDIPGSPASASSRQRQIVLQPPRTNSDASSYVRRPEYASDLVAGRVWIVYNPGPGDLVRVQVTPGPTLGFSNAELLPRARMLESPASSRNIDMSPDGTQFVGVVDAGTSELDSLSEVHVVLNWFEELKAKVPTQ